MDVVHPRCAGVDISKRDAKVCVRTAHHAFMARLFLDRIEAHTADIDRLSAVIFVSETLPVEFLAGPLPLAVQLLEFLLLLGNPLRSVGRIRLGRLL